MLVAVWKDDHISLPRPVTVVIDGDPTRPGGHDVEHDQPVATGHEEFDHVLAGQGFIAPSLGELRSKEDRSVQSEATQGVVEHPGSFGRPGRPAQNGFLIRVPGDPVMAPHGSLAYVRRYQGRHEGRCPQTREMAMPLFMDVHNDVPLDADANAVETAHQADLTAQERFGTRYINYWFDEASRKIFCLVDAPDPESAHAVHREAHGLVADEIYPVVQG
jgi:hypothetical protein